MLEVVNCYNSILDQDMEYQFFPKRQGDKECIFANIDLAIKILKWKPQKTLKDMCQSSWNVISNQ